MVNHVKYIDIKFVSKHDVDDKTKKLIKFDSKFNQTDALIEVNLRRFQNTLCYNKDIT